MKMIPKKYSPILAIIIIFFAGFWFTQPVNALTQVIYNTAGTDTFVVPTGITGITIKAWGAGGGGGAGGTAGGGGAGGGAGFAQGTITVTPSETLDIHVGGGGGGGGTHSYSGDGGGGGGRSEVSRSGTSLIVAAAGGGGGGGDNSSATAGGAGGVGGSTTGGTGGSSGSSTGGSGGTQSAGGSAGSGANTGTAGGSRSGGYGSDGGTTTNGSKVNGGTTNGGRGGLGDLGANGYSGGGGGGSSYYGGGGGGDSVASNAGGGGGGGGSSYTTGTATSNIAGSGTSAGNNVDSDYADNAGKGGTAGAVSGVGSSGNTGRIVIAYGIADGGVCSVDGDCSSNHCQNSICCVTGQTCCSSDSQCPADSYENCIFTNNYCDTVTDHYCKSSAETWCYRANIEEEIEIDNHSVCKKVTNNNTSDMFVPTKTADEWTAFRTNASGASITECCFDNGVACSSDGDCCSVICGTNADGDNYFSEAAGHTGICQSTSKPYTDCCDSDNLAYPGEGTYYSSTNNCGSWDYDCSGTTNKYDCTVRSVNASDSGPCYLRTACTSTVTRYRVCTTNSATTLNCGQTGYYYSCSSYSCYTTPTACQTSSSHTTYSRTSSARNCRCK